MIKSVAVREDHRRTGLGAKLFAAAEDHLREAGIQAVVSPVWFAYRRSGARSIVERRGYVVLLEDRDFWKAECEQGEFECVARSAHGCQCACKFYYKHLGVRLVPGERA